MIDLYADIWNGAPLDSNDYVICADQKTSIEARCLRARPALCASSTTTGPAALRPTWPPRTSIVSR
jgi:hypothetical protein